jgi:hypothetical protein
VSAAPQEVDEAELGVEEAKERKIMKLLLKVKNGTPPQRKAALRQLTDKARELGAGPLFNQILPLLVRVTRAAGGCAWGEQGGFPPVYSFLLGSSLVVVVGLLLSEL